MMGTVTQSNIILDGPGGMRTQTNDACLPSLTADQLELVNKAKKYAAEQSVKVILMKQNNPPTIQQSQNKTSQRHQALILMCRVYVGSISFELREETIRAKFDPFGAIKSINMSWDPVTLKHKGFAFVEYELPEAAQLALEHMNGIQLGGRQIKVGRPSNMPQAAPVIQKIQEECKEKNRIYVSNVHPDLHEPELATIFDPFGKVLMCRLAITPNSDPPKHRGYGFIEFESEAAAKEALTMDNLDLGGQILHACQATTPSENLTIYGTLESEVGSQTIVSSTEEDIQSQLERANEENQRRNDVSDELIDASNHNGDRASNRQEESALTEDAQTDHNQSLSNVIVLRNIVGSNDELDDSLQLDIYQECGKFGSVRQVVIYVDRSPDQSREDNQDEKETRSNYEQEVKIFVKYSDNTGSYRAREALDGRYFGGRKVSAEYYSKDLFRSSEYSK